MFSKQWINEKPFTMLQRIQSIYLFLVFLFAILYALFPLAQLDSEMASYSVRVIQFGSFFAKTPFTMGFLGVTAIVLWLAVVLMTVYMTFQYKNRLFQIKLGKLNMLLHAALILVSFFFIDNLRGQLENSAMSYGVGVLFPVFSLIFILMAIKAIRRDENLVRSADRIR